MLESACRFSTHTRSRWRPAVSVSSSRGMRRHDTAASGRRRDRPRQLHPTRARNDCSSACHHSPWRRRKTASGKPWRATWWKSSRASYDREPSRERAAATPPPPQDRDRAAQPRHRHIRAWYRCRDWNRPESSLPVPTSVACCDQPNLAEASGANRPDDRGRVDTNHRRSRLTSNQPLGRPRCCRCVVRGSDPR